MATPESVMKTLMDALKPGPPIALQPGQPGERMGYNPRKSLPYPIFVHDDNTCENVPGAISAHESHRPTLVGFQYDTAPDPDGLMLVEEWRAGDLNEAVGMFPVFSDHGDLFNLLVPITNVNEGHR